jgi:hypothetical protein
MGPSDQFQSMAEWHAAITQQNLSMGDLEREKWRRQVEASFDMWNRPRADSGFGPAADDTVNAINELIRYVIDLPENIGVAVGKVFGR